MTKDTAKRFSTGTIPLLYALPLADDGSPDNAKTYVRIPLDRHRQCHLRFILKAGSIGSSNAVLNIYQGSSFSHSVPFNAQQYCDIELSCPGAYAYHVSLDGKRGRSGYFVVEPRLYNNLPLDAVMIQSLIPKWMGPLSQWQSHIDLVKRSGYNMIHFAPMQQRGSSNSPYSIRDQRLFSDDLFDSPVRADERVRLVKSVLTDIQTKEGIMCLSDVVWNHTSFDSPFLVDHPDAGYNLDNSPHLRPAYELDNALLALSEDMDKHGLPRSIRTVQDVDAVVTHIKQVVFPQLKLWEYKVVDPAQYTDEAIKGIDPTPYDQEDPRGKPIAVQADLFARHAICDKPGVRFQSVDLSRAVSFVQALADSAMDRVTLFKKLVSHHNLVKYQEYDKDVEVALDNIRSRLIYTRLDEAGPRLGDVSKSCPLLESYFTRIENAALANNGWIWNADPMQDFAGTDSSAYLRREVIIWGDCVKLRFGQSPKDNPWLWSHMRAYTEQVASLFDGVRIDNCHSTPLHVAEYLLNAARLVNPDLYVLAELFTGSPEKDIHFVSRLGIHALVREAMQAWDPHELSRLVHRHGGKPVGSMDQDLNWKIIDYNGEKAWMIPIENGSTPRALFMDCTHDNQTPYQKRSAQDTLPNAAVVAFSDCATGSVKGYDEIYPYLLDIVDEKRLYSPFLKHPVGIVDVKAKLQKLHLSMSLDGYTEVHVHHEGDYILVHRQHPETHDGYLLIARTAFPTPQGGIKPIRLHMTTLSYLFGASLEVDIVNDETKYLMGFPSTIRDLEEPNYLKEPEGYIEIQLPDAFIPGSIYVFKTSIGDDLDEISQSVSDVPDTVIKPLDLLDCNVLLYRCEAEEWDASGGNGVYDVPNWGKMTYAGLEGFMSVLRPIIRDNDLGHPLCDNLRQGSWAMDYVQNRLKPYPHCEGVREWFASRFDTIRTKLPDFLVPKYFAIAIHTMYQRVRDHALSLMSPFVYSSLDPFVHQLALCSVQLHGVVPSTSLYPKEVAPTLAAGLPHFSHGYMRTWGRDVFLSLRGLLLVTGQYEAAKQHILGFAATLRYGLLPNLLDAGRSPRYNARDAVWFFMQSVQDYYTMAPNGASILEERVSRRFPKDNEYVSVEEGYTWECSLAELVQEIMQHHAQGIHFREHNAGTKIDSQMKDEGFNIDIQVDWSTGVLVGGNIWNCGTWMDKMGESEKAGNKGYPGTSRDGAPVEITGLLKSALRWILKLNRNQFPWTGVQVGNETVTYHDWNDRLQKNFERIYYIPTDPSNDEAYAVNPNIIHRRGIYKDVYKATEPYTEYQFRPNLCVAMVVAPELFDPVHAAGCLNLMNKVLLGPLGMRTLDPADMRYRPYYNNSDDSDDFDVAKGRNYHQGPEWLWLTGYYLRAAYKMGTLSPPAIARILTAHRDEIEQSAWAGLPELTNKDGETCWDSCFSQAWSASGLLDILYSLYEDSKA
ncbi:glycogen debranching enzyme [Fennellomyces sp. T-0311]|nr:glycogen debranching enzyme [Fennellomyces sp. T-0311]